MGKKIYLDSNDCKKKFHNKEIFVFGTGVDAEQAQKILSEYAIILAYVDNNRHGEGNYFYGKSIISLEQCLKERTKKQPIIIAAYRFGVEIGEQLTRAGLIVGEDFYLWDDMHIFVCDENTKEYIHFLSSIWKRTNRVRHEGIVLVPFYNRHDLATILLAYYGNYIAEKMNASIYAYMSFDSNYIDASEVFKDIYKAFNVETLIDSALNEDLKKEAEEICDSVWDSLLTWEDWKNITVYNICFGTTIIRHLLRAYIPSFDLKDQKMYLFLKKAIYTIVFWHHYIFENDIKAIFLIDGVSWEGYIRDIALTKGIPAYILTAEMAKATLDFHQGAPYKFFKKMWKQLTKEEQEYGIKWSKEHIEKRLKGGVEEVLPADRKNFAFAEGFSTNRILAQNEKIKIMICPHIFEEDCFYCGEQIFDNNYFAWLCHLGELSEKTPNYDWYLKMHPTSARRDFIIIDMILNKYSKIKRIPANVSPIQLKEEGMDYALTVYGSIGHEYPEIGIQVINAGLNPHSTFDFTWNPKTKEEYDELVMNLDNLEPKQDQEGLYQFYCLNYLFYDWNYIPWKEIFFENPLLRMDRLELEAIGKTLGTWKYKAFMDEWTEEKHEKIMSQLEDVFRKLDEWRPDILYKKICIEKLSEGDNS